MQTTITETLYSPKIKQTISPHDLSSIWDQYGKNIELLSLDCFDTILWRTSNTPKDVFYNLQHREAFHQLGFSASLRINAEAKARRLNVIRTGFNEAKLRDIYLAAFPDLNETQIKDLTTAELDEEITSCYVFPPILELMRTAISQGIPLIIVSDTYFNNDQLYYLLSQHLPEDVLTGISQIYCSCEYGKSKQNGLFNIICQHSKQYPDHTLHIGDNRFADFQAAQLAGLNAIHLEHHPKLMSELIRMQTVAVSVLDPTIHHTRAFHNPLRGILAANQQGVPKPEYNLGYATIGPLIYAFAKFILATVETIQSQGKQAKLLFLMRDAHLPALVCETILNKSLGARVRISRFVALAASFRTIKDVDRYLSDTAGTLRFDAICKQLLLPKEDSEIIIRKAKKAGNESGFEFIRLIRQKKILQKIFQLSKAYRQRLQRHLEKEANIQQGDTLIFVDLGYAGTAQTLLEPIFREEMGVDVIGRYLLSLHAPGWKNSRKGLLDPSWCDERNMLTLINYIALLEQICTSNEKSVINFDSAGNPIYSDVSVKQEQHAILHILQTECLHFTKDAERFLQLSGLRLSRQMLGDTALATLGRFIFMPTISELKLLQSFEFDINLGTKDILSVFNTEAGLKGLRERGLSFMEKNAKSMRTNYPAELRFAGLELSLFLLIQHRYNLEIRLQDLSLRREYLPVIVLRGTEASQSFLEAQPTHDGYFSLLIPVGEGNFQIGITFGYKYQWIQIDNFQLIKAVNLFGQLESEATYDAWEHIVFDQISRHSGNLFECKTDNSLAVFIPPPKIRGSQYVLRVIFRPLVSKAISQQTVE